MEAPQTLITVMRHAVERSLVRIDRRGGGPWVWTWRRLPGVETPV